MRRICVFALLTSALCVPALADPLTLNPGAYDSSGGQVAAAHPAMSAPSAAPVRVAAAQPDLDGGFIQFLVGGTQQSATQSGAGPSAQQARAFAGDSASSEPA